MNMEKLRETSYFYTGKASDIGRQLAMAAIALIWIFKTTLPDQSFELPPDLIFAALLIVTTLTLDFAQYIYGGIAWPIYHHLQEKRKVKEDDNFKAPSWINYPTNALFYLKLALALAAYVLMGSHLWSKLH